MRSRTARLLTGAVALWLGLWLALVGGTWAARDALDRARFVEAPRLAAALLTFRPSERAGQPRPVPATDFDPARSVRSDPTSCAPLSLLAVSAVADGEAWTGVNGQPAQPVSTLTARYADAAAARHELTAKRLALLRCPTVSLTFPPFDKPAESYLVQRRGWANAVGDRVDYALIGGGKTYEFYVRRFANTLTWSYGDDVSEPPVRHEIVDALIRRLAELARE